MTTTELDQKIDSLQSQGWILQADLGAQSMRNPMHFWTLRAGHADSQQVHTGRATTIEAAFEKLTESIARSSHASLVSSQ